MMGNVEFFYSTGVPMYVPETLSEIWDFLAVMVGDAPAFKSKFAPHDDLETRFYQLNQSFLLARKKLGEARYVQLLDLSARARAEFEADPGKSNGRAGRGQDLLLEIEAIIQDARRRRVTERAKDRDGEITGD